MRPTGPAGQVGADLPHTLTREDRMYLLDPTTALDLARFRVDRDLTGIESRRAAREAKAAAPRHRAPTRPGRHRSALLVGVLSARLGH
jgi:hypothetical protein